MNRDQPRPHVVASGLTVHTCTLIHVCVQANLREAAADALEDAVDLALCTALAEPARVEVARVLVRHGPADIAGIAAHLVLDRSVVSRHLKHLHDVGLVRMEKRGRHRFYELDGGAFVTRLERMAGSIRRIMLVCCPALVPAPEQRPQP